MLGHAQKNFPKIRLHHFWVFRTMELCAKFQKKKITGSGDMKVRSLNGRTEERKNGRTEGTEVRTRAISKDPRGYAGGPIN